jgi:hypothetical protein
MLSRMNTSKAKPARLSHARLYGSTPTQEFDESFNSLPCIIHISNESLGLYYISPNSKDILGLVTLECVELAVGGILRNAMERAGRIEPC